MMNLGARHDHVIDWSRELETPAARLAPAPAMPAPDEILPPGSPDDAGRTPFTPLDPLERSQP